MGYTFRFCSAVGFVQARELLFTRLKGHVICSECIVSSETQQGRGGEQQMLAIGRALMSRPSLLMLDEPSLGLAPIAIEQVFDKILELNKRTGLSVLLVEQNSAMALDISARAFVMETGTITLSGPSSALADDPRIREAYLGG
jgi:ABC-type branched-subunit amino acid transport system ATPase component